MAIFNINLSDFFEARRKKEAQARQSFAVKALLDNFAKLDKFTTPDFAPALVPSDRPAIGAPTGGESPARFKNTGQAEAFNVVRDRIIDLAPATGFNMATIFNKLDTSRKLTSRISATIAQYADEMAAIGKTNPALQKTMLDMLRSTNPQIAQEGINLVVQTFEEATRANTKFVSSAANELLLNESDLGFSLTKSKATLETIFRNQVAEGTASTNLKIALEREREFKKLQLKFVEAKFRLLKDLEAEGDPEDKIKEGLIKARNQITGASAAKSNALGEQEKLYKINRELLTDSTTIQDSVSRNIKTSIGIFPVAPALAYAAGGATDQQVIEDLHKARQIDKNNSNDVRLVVQELKRFRLETSGYTAGQLLELTQYYENVFKITSLDKHIEDFSTTIDGGNISLGILAQTPVGSKIKGLDDSVPNPAASLVHTQVNIGTRARGADVEIPTEANKFIKFVGNLLPSARDTVQQGDPTTPSLPSVVSSGVGSLVSNVGENLTNIVSGVGASAEQKKAFQANARAASGRESEATKKVKRVMPRQGVRPNPDGSVSTHLMHREFVPEDNRGWVIFPSLFQDEQDNWIDLDKQFGTNWEPILKFADEKGEVIEFGEDVKASTDFEDDLEIDKGNEPIGTGSRINQEAQANIDEAVAQQKSLIKIQALQANDAEEKYNDMVSQGMSEERAAVHMLFTPPRAKIDEVAWKAREIKGEMAARDFEDGLAIDLILPAWVLANKHGIDASIAVKDSLLHFQRDSSSKTSNNAKSAMRLLLIAFEEEFIDIELTSDDKDDLLKSFTLINESRL